MQRLFKSWRLLGAGLASGLVVLLLVRAWVGPALIVGELESLTGARVTIRGCWLGFGSSGVEGLTLFEGTGPGAPAWATAERVATDLTIGGLFLGRLQPRRLTLSTPRITLRLGRDGAPLYVPTFGGMTGEGTPPLPSIRVEGGQVTFRPEGRAEMVVTKIDATSDGGPNGMVLEGRADDPTWGRWDVRGTIAPDFDRGAIRLEGKRLRAGPETLSRIAFVPPEVWDHVVPQGPADVAVELRWAPGGARP